MKKKEAAKKKDTNKYTVSSYDTIHAVIADGWSYGSHGLRFELKGEMIAWFTSFNWFKIVE